MNVKSKQACHGEPHANDVGVVSVLFLGPRKTLKNVFFYTYFILIERWREMQGPPLFNNIKFSTY